MQERAGVRMLASRVITLWGCALGLGLLTARPSLAQWCSEPSQPFCLGIGQPDDVCRLTVEQYLRQERDFRQCVADEANAKVEESRTRANKVVERWNCYAAGSSF